MDINILNEEKTHLKTVFNKLEEGKQATEKSLTSLGAANLDRLQELRENPEQGMDFSYFIEQLQEKNDSMNIKDRFARLEEFGYLIKEPYFARIDLQHTDGDKLETIYIGKFGYSEQHPIVTDWRAKIASVFYKYRYPQKNVVYETPGGTEKRDLKLKRTFEIDNRELVRYFNNDIQFDERDIVIKKIEQRTGGVLEDIVETIQKDQMDIIESDPRQLCIVQGCVGSGKSTVAIHKLSHIFFNYPNVIRAERSILIAKNQILVGYLSTLFPKLGIFDIQYKTLRDLLVNVLYREEIDIKYNMDLNQDTSRYSLTKLKELDKQLDKVNRETESRIKSVFRDPEYESFGNYKYSDHYTPYENVQDIVTDLREELASQIEFIKENPQSVRVILCKENVRNIRKIIKSLEKISADIRGQVLNKLLKPYKINTSKELGYFEALVYAFLYAKIIGFGKFIPYEYCVVDEAQDFSPLEYSFMSKLVLRGRFALFGDLNQSIEKDGISGWNDLKLTVPDAKNAAEFILDTNYRSTEQIIKYANSILKPYTKKYLPKSINRMGNEPEELLFNTESELTEKFTESLKKDLNDLKRTIGVICFDSDKIELYKDITQKLCKNKSEMYFLDSTQKMMYKPHGVYIMESDNCKGLEFAKVYVLDLNKDSIKSVQLAKKAFVAVTRAMNDLSVYGIK